MSVQSRSSRRPAESSRRRISEHVISQQSPIPSLRAARMIVLCSAAVGLAACAKSAGSIDASYVSPLTYQAFTCDQLTQEYSVLKRRADETFQQQDRIASNDSVVMGVGLVLFWPALFFIDSSDKRHEVARMKGELRAVEDAATRKDCAGVSEAMREDQRRAEEAKARADAAAATSVQTRVD